MKEIKQEDIDENPEKYLEANIIDKDNFRIIDTIFCFIDSNSFENDDFKYTVDSACIFMKPHKKTFTPVSYYIKNNKKPIDFTNMNQGIPCNALSLLWNYKLYKVLMDLDEKNLNFIFIILLIASMILYGVSLYLKYGGGV